MKKIFISCTFIFVLFSCTDDLQQATDFTDIENPNLSESSVVGQPNSSSIWLSGIEREISRTLNEILILAELGSDNYENTQTFFNQFLDNLDIRTTDPDIRDTQNEIARVREMAKFGLETVGPNDENYNTEIEAEYNFYEGMSYLYAGMYFSALPQETLGQPISSTENLNSAIASFQKAIVLNQKAEYYLAMARANYYLGDKSQAVAAATSALGISSDFTKEAMYDELNNPDNTFEDALYERGTFDDLQPLPTLDFLDPKYSFIDTDTDPSVHFLKAEEALLILAEAALSDNDSSSAKQYLSTLLTLVNSREVRIVDESIEGRTESDPGSRPNMSDITVNGRTGLVIDRNTMAEVSSISGTSLTQAEIDSIENNDAGLALLYRTRQEIFIAEGLRFVDMGVKLVIHENEILQNDNISDGDPSTVPVIPSFVDSVIKDLDGFTYNSDAKTVQTTINLNEILAANKASNEVLPFH